MNSPYPNRNVKSIRSIFKKGPVMLNCLNKLFSASMNLLLSANKNLEKPIITHYKALSNTL